jgi:3-hydroxyacyl-CoA dehydrogenase
MSFEQRGGRLVMEIRRVAVIGTGTIGASWAANFLAAGLDVAAWDPAPDAEGFLRRFVEKAWPALERLGMVRAGASRARLSFHPTAAAAVDGAGFVQESGPEREEVKIALFAELDGALPPDAIIASSSSGLLVSRLQSRCRHPERCVLGHPFNPPHLIPLVEVVGGAKTDPAAIERALDFYAGIGKRPIPIRKEVRGHVANRLQAALWREAIHLVVEGVASVADVDAAIAYGPGLRWALMGPHLTFHLAGGTGGMTHFMEHLTPPMQSWMDDLGAPRLTPDVQRRIIEGVAEEAAGRNIEQLTRWRDEKLVEILEVVGGKGAS